MAWQKSIRKQSSEIANWISHPGDFSDGIDIYRWCFIPAVSSLYNLLNYSSSCRQVPQISITELQVFTSSTSSPRPSEGRGVHLAVGGDSMFERPSKLQNTLQEFIRAVVLFLVGMFFTLAVYNLFAILCPLALIAGG